MAAAPVIFCEQCSVCSKWRNPHEMQHLPGGALRCWKCYYNHLNALHAISTGEPPAGCHECGITYEQLTELPESGNTGVAMFLHWKDGTYQFLCRRCSDGYERKRLDLYGNTVHGYKKKLKGAK